MKTKESTKEPAGNLLLLYLILRIYQLSWMPFHSLSGCLDNSYFLSIRFLLSISVDNFLEWLFICAQFHPIISKLLGTKWLYKLASKLHISLINPIENSSNSLITFPSFLEKNVQSNQIGMFKTLKKGWKNILARIPTGGWKNFASRCLGQIAGNQRQFGHNPRETLPNPSINDDCARWNFG